MLPQRERREVTNKVLAYLNALPETKAIKTYADGHLEVGTPDVIACHKGRTIVIECKVAPNKPTKIQQHRLCEWKEAGAVSIVAYGVGDVQCWIEALDARQTMDN